MAAHILKMSDADTVRFLEYYQDEPVLWDPTRGDYKKRECRIAAARRIAVAMDIRGFTETHVIMKFKNLRSSYSQELKKISESSKLGFSLGEVYVPKVAWFKLMDSFIKPHVKSRTALSNVETLDTKYGILANEETIIEHNPYTFQDPLFTSKEVEERRNRQQEKKKSQDTSTVHAKKKKYFDIETSNENSISSPAMESLPGISEKAPYLIREDSFDHFGKYIASLLRSLPQKRSSQLQSEIVSMILMPTIQSESRHSSSYSQYSNSS